MKIFIRFTAWWAGVSGFLATADTCPCCGGPPCVRGVALLGFFSALLTFVLKSKPQEEHGANLEPCPPIPNSRKATRQK